MPTTFTPTDINLLGYSDVEIKKETTGYDIMDAKATVGLDELTTRFVYLKARCKVEDAENAASDARSGLMRSAGHAVYVVKAPSLSINDRTLQSAFGANTNLFSHERLVWNILRRSFAGYLDHAADNVPNEDHFIAPRLVEAGVQTDLVKTLVDYLSGQSQVSDNGTLKVLSANAGVGKTTLSRHLMHELIKRIGTTRTIPIYVEAQHWDKLNLAGLEELWDVIDNSLRMFSPHHIRITDMLFRHALRQGYFCFIFDGFDELCGRGAAQFDPTSVLNELHGVVAESEARVLMTTRTLFWKAKISQAPTDVKVEMLDAFNSQQAKGYFTKVFQQSTPEHHAANELYSRMVKEARPPQHTGSVRDQFVNLPLCVRMIADYVRRGGASVTVAPDKPALQSFLTAICDREIQRHGLSSSAEAQLASFKDMALTYNALVYKEGTSPSFRIDDLATTPDGFSLPDARKAIDHPLLTGVGGSHSERYWFQYDFMSSFLLASSVCDWIREPAGGADNLPDSILATLTEESDGKGHVLEQLLNFLDMADLDRVVEKGRLARLVGSGEYVESFFFHVAHSLLRGDPNLGKRERTDVLFNRLYEQGWDEGKPQRIHGWQVRGLVDGLDLRGITFSECRFKDVTFHRCRVDRSTGFANCLFEGDQAIEGGTEGWRNVFGLAECSFVFPADVAWERLVDGTLGDTEDRVTHMLSMGLRKFWYHGNIRGSLRTADWKKGLLARTGKADEVLDVMLKVGLVKKIDISGVDEGGLAFDRNSIGDLQNYMDNNQLSGKVEAVYQHLRSDWL